MPSAQWSAVTASRIIKRVVIETDLILETPAHFGNGDGDDVIDMPLITDALDGRSPLLTGASICGALRSYLRSLENANTVKVAVGSHQSISELLFGAAKNSDGDQSRLVVDDAIGKFCGLEFRHGVQIVSSSRTAAAEKLYSFQLWQAGTIFPLHFELNLKEGDDEKPLLQGLATALEGLSVGAITLGARKTRGFGRVSTGAWHVRFFDMTSEQDMIAWIKSGGEKVQSSSSKKSPFEALSVGKELFPERDEFEIDASFQMLGSMIIRSSIGLSADEPDVFHIQTKDSQGRNVPIVPGTSMAGVLRSRAQKIESALSAGGCGRTLLEEIFGSSPDRIDRRHASRLTVSETVVKNAVVDLVQHRVSIDRFTGGAVDTALFSENPLFAQPQTMVTCRLRLSKPRNGEIGLLLLLLKDLWEEDLPIGGGSSVGRGRLRGTHAKISLHTSKTKEEWTIRAAGKSIEVIGDKQSLEKYVDAFGKELVGA